MALDPTVVALIGTIMGGVGLKIAEYFLGKGRVKVDDASRIRDELRLEITALRTENHQLETERDKWRSDYYALYQKNMGVTTDLQLLRGQYDKQAQAPPVE